MIRRISVLAGGVALIAGAWACDSLSNPENERNPNVTTARVRGGLVGNVPAGTRVAVVWKTANGLARGADVAVDNGQFAMDVGTPDDAYLFAQTTGTGTASPDMVDAGPTQDVPTSLDASIPTRSLRPQTAVSGTATAMPLRIGQAGFIVYTDDNTNGQLDLDADGAPTDTVIGANRQLVLTYLGDGTSYDYETLRDRAGILPNGGFNLAWTGGEGLRWFPLDNVQLTLAERKLPPAVCANHVSRALADASTTYECSTDGRQFYELTCTGGLANDLCSGSAGEAPGCTRPPHPFRLFPGDPIPPSWPCGEAMQDAGPAPLPLEDGGAVDSGAWFPDLDAGAAYDASVDP